MVGFGSMLKDYLEYNRITQSEFADMLGISQKHVSEIINGSTRISEELMVAISLITDIDINVIAYMENKKDMHNYLINKFKNEKDIKTFLNSYCIKEMEERNWIKLKHKDDLTTTALDLLNFLKIKSFDIETSYMNNRILYKKNEDADMKKILLWVRHCDSLIANINVPIYQASKLPDLINELLLESKKEFNKESIIKLFNKYGIILVLEDALKGSKVRGCTSVKVKTPVIYLTSYFKTKDSFYFTLFHEIGHIKSDYNKLINKILIYEEDETSKDEFALNIMIDKRIKEEINKMEYFDNQVINDLSKNYNISKSFIVGYLARINKISYKSKIYNDNIERITF